MLLFSPTNAEHTNPIAIPGLPLLYSDPDMCPWMLCCCPDFWTFARARSWSLERELSLCLVGRARVASLERALASGSGPESRVSWLEQAFLGSSGLEKDAALGNGGLGRLASYFLDSMETLNLPAWGSLAIGKLSDMTLCSLSDFLVKLKYIPLDRKRKWVGGEVVQALAYDVPIPGYKTKNTINLHLWEAKAGAENFNLFQFNDGQYESAAQLHFRAQQDVIVRFKERKDEKSSWQWYEFPNKVVVQLNDTHPTLAIPELMRLLMDDDGLGWDEAWDVTTRAIAYTNHTVLPEALEKCSQAVMWKLLPHHMEIIEEIDKRFIAMIRSTKPELESKLSSMRIMDNNPQKPVMRMANLCVVSSHTIYIKVSPLERPNPRSSVIHRLPLERQNSSSSAGYSLPELLQNQVSARAPTPSLERHTQHSRSSDQSHARASNTAQENTGRVYSPLERQNPRSSGQAKIWATSFGF
ncbi:hypothetical protein HYC85_015840 [Camellia sinensis]|uniref:Alpha-1,4 glucan phosphorylase n=1 Tax=Camellia sinensis TaxID=4442 RepID=A0A7J7GXV4_CAMSI|nr:hypothetical protein HYC85_015840 [Camellia sinensis]